MEVQYWINSFKSYDKDFGYNKSPVAGSCLGYKHSEQTRANMSKAHQGSNNHMFGRTGNQAPMYGRRGDKSPQAKLTSKEVVEIKHLLKDGTLRQKEIAEMFNVKPTTITAIKKGRSWGHIKI